MATIYDVAAAAGVSIKTVSRVLNEEVSVRLETRKRVQHAMKTLSYAPSIAARTIGSQKTDLIGVITSAITSSSTLPEWAGLPSIDLVKGIQGVMEEAGKIFMIADARTDARRSEKIVQTFREHRVEGMLYIAEYHQPFGFSSSFKGIPTMLVNCFDQSGKIPCVIPAEELGGYQLAEAAIKKGHRRVGFLTLSPKIVAGDLRTKGFKRAHQEMGIPLDEELIIPAHMIGGDAETKNRLMIEGLDRLLGLTNPPTIICCGNDRMAMKLYMLLHQRGIRIPEQISVIGFDDYIMISEMLEPDLTTIELPYEEIGRRGAQRLLNLLQNKQNESKEMVESITGKVIWRHSVKDLL